MSNNRKYTIEEDVCIAEAMLHHNLVFRGHSLRNVSRYLQGVYDHFVDAVAVYDIDGTRRTRKSLEGRIYALKTLYDSNRLDRDDSGHPLAKYRIELWSRVVRGITKYEAESSGSISTERMPAAGRKSMIEQYSRQGGIEKKRMRVDAKRLLHTLDSIQRMRTELYLKREETLQLQQEDDQRTRLWKIEQFNKILENSKPEDEVKCSQFLEKLEDITTNDTRLCMLREEQAQMRLENDREISEREIAAFDALVSKFFD